MKEGDSRTIKKWFLISGHVWDYHITDALYISIDQKVISVKIITLICTIITNYLGTMERLYILPAYHNYYIIWPKLPVHYNFL